MVQDVYRKMIPIGLRYRIANIREKRHNNILLKELDIQYREGNYEPSWEEELRYILKNKKIEVFPYVWTREYENKTVEILKDDKYGMKYVLHKGKKLFFPKGYSDTFIKKYYLSLIMEQDERSPHCYFENNEDSLKDCIFVDVGAAEGIISLEIIDKVQSAILFECNEAWKKALEATFSPWHEKIQIVSKFAGNVKGKDTVELDDWFSTMLLDAKRELVLKLDVEGSEKEVLQGAEKLLQKAVKTAYVCTYHRQEDFEILVDMLKKYDYNIKATEGYMFYGTQNDESFRKGVIRAYKN